MGGLGRLISPDVRNYLPENRMSSLVSMTAPLPQSHYYIAPSVLDQGQTEECTSFAWRQLIAINGRLDTPDPNTFYSLEQQIDGIQPIPHDGSTVQAGAKVAQNLGYISSYVWDNTVAAILPFLAYHGPVVFGTAWYEGMSNPDPTTYVMHATGALIGGHCYVITGFDLSRSLLRMVQSWGLSFADNGYAWLPFDDADRLLMAQGEACAAVIVPKS